MGDDRTRPRSFHIGGRTSAVGIDRKRGRSMIVTVRPFGRLFPQHRQAPYQTAYPVHKLCEVAFLSRVSAEAFIPDGSESVISITDRGAEPADLKDGWNSILRIQFNDVDTDEDDTEELELELGEITEEEAEEIANFALQAANVSEVLVVHCRFGQSRSPAVAKAICEHFKLDFPPDFTTHNRLVQRLVRNALSRHSAA